jgi:hypothetical protein
MEYFSDQERSPKPRKNETISPTAWGGIVSHIQMEILNGAFGYKFPSLCPESRGTVGTDEQAFSLALLAEIPNLSGPLETSIKVQGGLSSDRKPYAPDTLTILDLVQFCHKYIAKPVKQNFHEFFEHFHLTFDERAGKEEFRSTVNIIFARNGVDLA